MAYEIDIMTRADRNSITGVIKLECVWVEKPWGRDRLPAPFAHDQGARIGEIWFPAPEDAPTPLLVKYLFTGEALSVQVHPDDSQAHVRGLSSGKEECWYIVDAEPGATLGIGTKRPLAPEQLRAAALSGEIESLMDWYQAEAGQIYHIPPGTIHAIGAGISLIEVQQNSDITYRLYDYGRPRALHLDDAVAVAKAIPFPPDARKAVDARQSGVLLDAAHFTLAQITDADQSPLDTASGMMNIIPVRGKVTLGAIALHPGECALAPAGTQMHLAPDAQCLVAWPKA